MRITKNSFIRLKRKARTPNSAITIFLSTTCLFLYSASTWISLSAAKGCTWEATRQSQMQVIVPDLRALILRQGWFSGGFSAVCGCAGAGPVPEPCCAGRWAQPGTPCCWAMSDALPVPVEQIMPRVAPPWCPQNALLGVCEHVLCILHPKMNYLGECLPCCALVCAQAAAGNHRGINSSTWSSSFKGRITLLGSAWNCCF